MKKIVLRYGLASGAMVAILVGITMPLHSEVLGYSSMVLSFLLVFFGVRSYRETVAGGAIGFGKAFQVGILITLVTCSIYVLAWEIAYFNFFPNFLDQYSAHVLAEMHAAGKSEAEIARKAAEMAARQALQEPALQHRRHLPGDLPGRADHDPDLRRDPAPEAAPERSRVGRDGLTLRGPAPKT